MSYDFTKMITIKDIKPEKRVYFLIEAARLGHLHPVDVSNVLEGKLEKTFELEGSISSDENCSYILETHLGNLRPESVRFYNQFMKAANDTYSRLDPVYDGLRRTYERGLWFVLDDLLTDEYKASLIDNYGTNYSEQQHEIQIERYYGC